MRRPPPPLPSLNDETIVRNSAYNLLGTGLPVLLAVAAVPVTIRLMGLERFALLSLLWAALRMAVIPCAGYAAALVRNVSHGLGGQAGQARLAAVIRTSFLLQAGVSLTASALLWLGAGWLAGPVLGFRGEMLGEAEFAFRAAAAILPLYSAAMLFASVLSAHQRFRAQNAVRLSFEVLFLLLPPAVFAAGGGLRELAAGLLAGQALNAGAYLLLLRRRGLLDGVPRAAFAGASELGSYAGWITLAKAAAMGAEETVRFTTGAVCGPAALAVYNIAHEVYTALAILPSSFLGALFPAYASACGREDKTRLDAYFYAYAGKLLLFTSLAFSGLILFAPEILLLLTGAEPSREAVPALQLLAAAELAAGTSYVGSGWFNGRNRPGVPARVQAASLLLLLPACWAGAVRYGIAGAAGAMLLKTLFENALYILAAERHGAGAGRGAFAGAALFAAGLTAGAAALCAQLPQGSYYKTGAFLAALAATGLAGSGLFGRAAAERQISCGAGAE